MPDAADPVLEGGGVRDSQQKAAPGMAQQARASMDDHVAQVCNLSETEKRLWSAFARGELVDLRAGDPEVDDPRNSGLWPQIRRVRAEVVTALLLGAVKPAAGFVPGVHLAGAYVEGTMDVQHGVVGCVLEMKDCCCNSGIVLASAKTRTVDLSGSVLQRIDATSAVIDGDLVLDQARATAIAVDGAHVTGSVSLHGAHLANPGHTALAAPRMTVDGDLGCTGRFHAEGEVTLTSAHIGGKLSLDGAHLANRGSSALTAEGLTVDGDLTCADKFRAEGRVRLSDAHIRGMLDLDGAHLTNHGGEALTAYRLAVDGDMGCMGTFCAEGEMELTWARIGGNLFLDGAHLTNSSGNTLTANGLTVQGSMTCGDGFRSEGDVVLQFAHVIGHILLEGVHQAKPGGVALRAAGLTADGLFFGEQFCAEGAVKIPGAHIKRGLALVGAHFFNPDGIALDADRLIVDGDVSIRSGVQAKGSIKLTHAHVTGQLELNDATTLKVDLGSAVVNDFHDQPGSWPKELLLDGFTYQNLQPCIAATGNPGRLTWLARDPTGFHAQPYEQLAGYYRSLGQEEEARTVLLAKQRHQRAEFAMPRKVGSWTLDALVGYGYRPSRAFAWLIALLIAGSVYFSINPPAPLNPARHPPFQPFLYTAKLVIPLVSFGQDATWVLGTTAQWVAAILTSLGWIFATAAVAGVTRVLTRK
jgi:hypothetical protein